MKNERGLTLIELLAVIVISAIILILTTSIIITSIRNYDAISDENELRDEADLLMSQVYKKLYTLKESQIQQSSSTNTYIELTSSTCPAPATNCIVGFKPSDQNFYLGSDQPYSIVNNSIGLVEGSVKKVKQGVYEIKVTLKMKNKSTVKEFENVVRSINDQ